jgi:hypothetical protein
MQLTMQSNLIDIFTTRLNANTCNKRRGIYAIGSVRPRALQGEVSRASASGGVTLRRLNVELEQKVPDRGLKRHLVCSRYRHARLSRTLQVSVPFVGIFGFAHQHCCCGQRT